MAPAGSVRMTARCTQPDDRPSTRTAGSRKVRIADIVVPELYECAKICVAKKRTADAIYYSGISVDQLRWFLHRFDYPEAVTSFVDEHRADFDHLMFDVGIDYRSGPDGTLEYPKTGYYSTL